MHLNCRFVKVDSRWLNRIDVGNLIQLNPVDLCAGIASFNTVCSSCSRTLFEGLGKIILLIIVALNLRRVNHISLIVKAIHSATVCLAEDEIYWKTVHTGPKKIL